MVWTSSQDASQAPCGKGVSDMSHQEESLGQRQNSPEGLDLFADLRKPGAICIKLCSFMYAQNQNYTRVLDRVFE